MNQSTTLIGKGRVVLSRALVAIAVAFAIVLGALPALTPAAQAAVNDKIVVELLSFKAYSDASGTNDNAIRVNEVAELAFRWDARAANPQPGDSFVIGLPAQFRNRQIINKPLIWNHITVGDCEIALMKITCTFNDKIIGHHSIDGTAAAQMLATDTTTTNQVEFTINESTAVAIATPGGKPVGPALAGSYKEQGFGKSITPFGQKTNELTWSLTFGTSVIEEISGQRPDGNTVLSFTVNDVLSYGAFFDPARPYFELVQANSIDNPTGKNVRMTDTQGVDKADQPGVFTVVAEPITERETNYTISGPFKPDTNYVMVYKAYPKTDDGYVKPGVEYVNTAAVRGTRFETSFSRNYTDSFSITVNMEQNFGSFKVSKNLLGEKAAVIPDDQKFDVSVRWELPDNKQASDYPTWTTAPQENPFTVAVSSGAYTQYPNTFPAGTKLYISEPNPPQVENVVWGEPQFVSGAKRATNELMITVENQKSTPVTVRNTANAAKATFKLSKVTNGLTAAAPLTDQNFTFSYICDSGAHGEITATADGQQVESPALPVGDTCQVSENAPTNTPDGWNVQTEDTKDIVIAAGNTASVSFTNTYTQKMASFSVKKAVKGDYVPNDADEFTVIYTCDGVAPADLVIKPGAQGVAGPQLPVGTRCSIVEKASSAERDGYTVETTYDIDGTASSQFTIAEGATPVATVTNTYARKMGTFSVTKAVTGTTLPADASFTFTYTCGTINDTLTVLNDGQPVVSKPIPTGTECVVTEQAPTNTPDTYALTAPAAQTITITDTDQPHALTFTNAYIKKMGKVAVKKVTSGDVQLANDQFPFTLTCENADAVAFTVTANGDAWVSDPIDVGTTCTVAEADPTNTPEGWTLAKPEAQEVTIGDGEPAELTFTNAYTKKKGAFSVKKITTGVDLGANATFTFSYTCDGNVNGSLDVTANGPAVEGPELDYGTQCEIAEETPTNTPADFILTAPEKQTVSVKDSTSELTFTNVYAKKTGKIAVKKVTVGDAPLATTDFAFTLSCVNAQDVDFTVGANGEAWVSDPIAVGTECSIVEKDPTNTPQGWTLTKAADQKVTVMEGAEPTVVTFTNEYAPIPEKKGTFTVTKNATGLTDPKVVDGKTFLFDYTCTDDSKGTLTVAYGETVQSPELKHGITCTVTENAEQAKIEGYTLVAPGAQQVTIDEAAPQKLVFTNSYRSTKPDIVEPEKPQSEEPEKPEQPQSEEPQQPEQPQSEEPEKPQSEEPQQPEQPQSEEPEKPQSEQPEKPQSGETQDPNKKPQIDKPQSEPQSGTDPQQSDGKPQPHGKKPSKGAKLAMSGADGSLTAIAAVALLAGAGLLVTRRRSTR